MSERQVADATEIRDETAQGVIDSALKLFFLGLVGFWVFSFVRPFISLVIWGAILGVCLNPLHRMLLPRFGGRRGLCATAMVASIVCVLVVPVGVVSQAAFDNIKEVTAAIKQDTLAVPSPPEALKNLPMVGSQAYELWSEAENDFSIFKAEHESQIRDILKKITRAVGGVGGSMLHFLASLVVAGAFISFASGIVGALNQVLTRIVGSPGPELTALAGATILSVAKGVLGVALVQAALYGIGVFVMGTPFAGLLTLGMLLLAVLQIPAFLIAAPVAVYEFQHADMLPAVIFALWSAMASLSDNVLKPLLLGRGVDVPMLVVLAGAIGGLLATGFVGLFEGAVVLAVAYTLFQSWLTRGILPATPAGEDGERLSG